MMIIGKKIAFILGRENRDTNKTAGSIVPENIQNEDPG